MERRVEQKSPERAALLVLPGEAAIAAHELSHRINAALHGTTRHTKEAVRKQILSYLQRYEDVQQYVGQGMKLHKDTPKRQTCEVIITLARWRTAQRLMPEERRLEALLEQGRTPDADSIWISRWLVARAMCCKIACLTATNEKARSCNAFRLNTGLFTWCTAKDSNLQPID